MPEDRDDELTRFGHTPNHMLDRLEASTERKRRFIADASPELRTPLSLLRAELDVALHRPRTAEELTETLRAVDAEVQRLIDLSNALLDLEELGSTRHITRAPADLARLVDAAASLHRRTFERTGRSLTADTPHAPVNVDVRWLRPALGHLAHNALRHGQGDVPRHRDRPRRQAPADRHRSRARPPAGLPAPGLRPLHPCRSQPHSRGSGLGLTFVAAVARCRQPSSSSTDNR
ncbi:HAMP domain-containing sensor histidine kinase [Streptomyces diastatochromogenes]|nr:HAMP domain-containing sensor histidine kinase [Streptomyces diastatochromogenes]